MHKAQISRREVWWEVLALPTWKWAVTLPLFILGTATLARDEFLPTDVAAKYKLPILLPAIAWYWWALFFLIVSIFILLESAFRAIRLRQEKIAELTTPTLTATFDPTKPPWRDKVEFRFYMSGQPARNGMVYRIQVTNIGGELIKNCEAQLVELAFENEPAELGVAHLTWSGDYPPVSKVDLKSKFMRDIDVIVIYEDGNVRVPMSGGWPPNNRQDFFARRGRYRFTIVIGGEGSATLPPCKLCLNYTGDWETSTMEAIPHDQKNGYNKTF